MSLTDLAGLTESIPSKLALKYNNIANNFTNNISDIHNTLSTSIANNISNLSNSLQTGISHIGDSLSSVASTENPTFISPESLVKSFYEEMNSFNLKTINLDLYRSKSIKYFSIILIILLLIPSYQYTSSKLNFSTLNLQSTICTVVPYGIIFLDQLIILFYNRENIKLTIIVLSVIFLVIAIDYLRITRYIQSFGAGFIRHSVFYNSKSEMNTLVFFDYVFSVKTRGYAMIIFYIIISTAISGISMYSNSTGNKIVRSMLITYLIVGVCMFGIYKPFIVTILIFSTVMVVLLHQKEESKRPQRNRVYFIENEMKEVELSSCSKRGRHYIEI